MLERVRAIVQLVSIWGVPFAVGARAIARLSLEAIRKLIDLLKRPQSPK